ncbi:MAG: MmcQ/YjbR family DNA-binding protein [Saprospiraceae bacterium]|nr:MmcQ/YjbR family DNA-binding protein [Saprospiraceae bacterium]
MDIEYIQTYCMNKKAVTYDFPFDEHTLAFRVCNKIFALASLDEVDLKINLKCDPDYAIELRERYDDIQPGYHMNKKMWNTVNFSSNIENTLLLALIDHSYDEVVKKLSKKEKEQLND